MKIFRIFKAFLQLNGLSVMFSVKVFVYKNNTIRRKHSWNPPFIKVEFRVFKIFQIRDVQNFPVEREGLIK